MISPHHTWFKGPDLGGVVVSERKFNGCLETFTPVDAAGISAWESLKGHPLEVLMPGSRFVGYSLRRAPRGRDFCLAMFTLAFPKSVDVSDWDAVLPPYLDGMTWALTTFERAGFPVAPPPWAPDFGEDRKSWPGVIRARMNAPAARIRTYHPQTTIDLLRQHQLPVPEGLEAEAAEWRAAARSR